MDSLNPHGGVPTQFLFYSWNLLYHHLFPSETLMNSELLFRQLGGLTSLPLHQAVNGMTPFSAGIATLPYSLGPTLISIPAAWFLSFWQIKGGNMSGQKWMSFVRLIIGALGFGASTIKNLLLAAF